MAVNSLDLQIGIGKIHGMSPKEVHRRSEELLERVGLIERAREEVRKFSGGMKRSKNATHFYGDNGGSLGSNTMGTISLGVIDQDKSPVSAAFVEEGLNNLPNYKFVHYESVSQAKERVRTGDIVAFVVIPPGLGAEVSKLWSGQQGNISLGITYDAVEAARGVMVRGAGLETISHNLIILTIYTLALFVTGIVLFRRNMAR